jgi:hypothetical protein
VPLGDLQGQHIDELGSELRLAILKKHLDDLAQVLEEFVGVGAFVAFLCYRGCVSSRSRSEAA